MSKTSTHSRTPATSREPAATSKRYSDPQLPQKRLQLSRAQNARWLNQLGKVIGDGEQDFDCLEQLRDSLEDSGWLACWKREDVIVELCPSVLAGVLRELLSAAGSDYHDEHTEIFDEILGRLSVCSSQPFGDDVSL